MFNRKDKGFLTILLSIISVSFFVFSCTTLNSERKKEAKIGMNKFDRALYEYKHDQGKYPDRWSKDLSTTTKKNSKESYLEKYELSDPWGSPYDYDVLIKVRSNGPDRKAHTSDDVICYYKASDSMGSCGEP